MATLGDLKQRIITETNRDDLADELAGQLALSINQAIEYYQGERFWFNAGGVTVSTVPGVAELAMPATMRMVDHIVCNGRRLDKHPLIDLVSRTDSGEPYRYAEYGDGFWLSPTPSAAFPLSLVGVRYMPPPGGDSDETVWTKQAYDLIAAHTRLVLYRDALRDTEGAELAKAGVAEAVTRLQQETARRNDSPLRVAADMPMGWRW